MSMGDKIHHTVSVVVVGSMVYMLELSLSEFRVLVPIRFSDLWSLSLVGCGSP
jgi:hypothetical protein